MATTDDELTEAQRERIQALEGSLKHLRSYLDRPAVQEVAVNAPGAMLTWENGEWITHPDEHVTYKYLDSLTADIANFAGHPFSNTKPLLDTELHTGERFHAKRPPVTPNGHINLNVRKHIVEAYPFHKYNEQGYFKHTKHQFSLLLSDEDRVRIGKHLEPEELELWDLAKDSKWVDFYTKAVRTYQNIVTSGATCSGKTTYSRSLMELTDPKERYITLQDARETAMPNHPNRQDLLFIKGNPIEMGKDGKPYTRPGITAKQGLESAMRSTPTRIHISELRGDEAMYYLSGVLSSGHPGGITTTHANSPKDAFLRLALLIKQSQEGQGIELEAVKSMLYQTINVVGQLKFDQQDKCRRLTAVYYDPFYRASLLG